MFIEYNEFPGGLMVEWETDLGVEYRRDLLNIKNNDDLQKFRKKWVDIFFEMEKDVDVDRLINVRDNLSEQYKEENRYLFGYLLPSFLLIISLRVMEFQVPAGVVLLQMFNAGVIERFSDGKWRVGPNWFQKVAIL